MNLKKRILKELDDLDWIRDVELFVPFESAKRGELYKVEIINASNFIYMEKQTLQEAEQKCYDHINDTTNDEVHVEIVKTED